MDSPIMSLNKGWTPPFWVGIKNGLHCSTTKLSILLTSTLGTIKNLIINCSNKAFENSGITYFWSVKHSLEVLEKLTVPNQEYDSCCPFVWCVLSFDFDIWLGTFRFEFFPEFSIFVILLFACLYWWFRICSKFWFFYFIYHFAS